ncbi:hypothetical protein P154DRAFT_333689 [Amniculicola lignicola CBS 123094]|uniref:Uncharacterized protein n=1 Tax=Amniculicola lignicola CBS 123094 TaxID=1392246 RepID=A0A6A5W422_9PLEO|nr:hypothetical protein P154DRAFT_333689 [Amniculicola lignicola CBS 123094]
MHHSARCSQPLTLSLPQPYKSATPIPKSLASKPQKLSIKSMLYPPFTSRSARFVQARLSKPTDPEPNTIECMQDRSRHITINT